MKLVMVILALSANTLWASVSAQNVRMDLFVEQKSLIEVMDLIKQKSGYSFIYSAGDVEQVGKISMVSKNKTIREILDLALQGTNLFYSIEDDLIILKKTNVLAQQQQKTRVVTGVVLGTAVTDTLPGVTVMVKGTSKVWLPMFMVNFRS